MHDVVGIFAVDTTDNITHAAIGGVGLLIGLIPEAAQRRAGVGGAEHGHGGHASHA